MTNGCPVTIKTDKNVERTRILVRTYPCLGIKMTAVVEYAQTKFNYKAKHEDVCGHK